MPINRSRIAAAASFACVGAAAVDVPIQQHVYAALASGDISREEMQEFVLHFAYYSRWPRASRLREEVADKWLIGIYASTFTSIRTFPRAMLVTPLLKAHMPITGTPDLRR